MNGLTLVILTPEGEACRLPCEAVTLFARDNEAGEGGGSVGIRRGHIPALIALEPGSIVKARAEGGSETRYKVSRGFAAVKDDIVTAAAETAERITD